MVNHAVPTEKLCVPFGLHPVVERVSVFKYLYHTTQAAHCQDDFPNFGAKNSKPTLLENSLEQLNIRYKLIKPYTPRHNGKVERSHRKDNEEFYATHRFFSFVDFKL